MHVIKVHPGQPVPKKSKEQALADKREYNRKYRERKLAEGLTTGGTSPKKRPMTGHERYVMYRDKYRAQGLNAKGKPLKMGGKALSAIRKAQKMRRQRERREKLRLLNGAQPQQEPMDNLGDTARAIILAAQVLRSVSVGLKL